MKLKHQTNLRKQFTIKQWTRLQHKKRLAKKLAKKTEISDDDDDYTYRRGDKTDKLKRKLFQEKKLATRHLTRPLDHQTIGQTDRPDVQQQTNSSTTTKVKRNHIIPFLQYVVTLFENRHCCTFANVL